MEVALIGPLGRIVLGITKVTIGRAPDNTLVLGDSNVSSHHAEIRPEGQYFSLVDLNSTNGTFVNEQQVNHSAPHLLQHGDIIRVGNTKFTFEVSNVPQSYSDGLTKRAAPPVDNTNYGMGILNAGGQQSYTPPPPPPPQVSETQVPTYISLPYGQSGQPQYTPPQLQAQQPQYTPPQLPSPISNLHPTQQQKRSLGRTFILGVIALVIILASIAGFFIYHNNQVALNNTNMTATAQTQANNTTTAQNNLTAIARVNATATFVTNPYPPNSGSLTLFDPLKDNSKGHRWDEGTTGASSCKFTGGTFHVTSGSKNVLNSCFANTTNFSDFAYQVELTIVKGDCGGLIFRADSTNSKFYSFEMCQDGTYSVLLFSSNSSSKYLLKLTTNAAIKTGLNQANVIAAIANAGTIQLYVNNISVDSVTYTTLRQGEIGLLADDYTNVTDVAFDNAKVWTL